MDKTRVENKGEKLIKSLNKQVARSSNMLKDALDLAAEYEKEILKSMTPKEIARKKAFDVKVPYLLNDGKIKEAEALKKQYLNE